MLRSARNPIESAFGRLKARWSVLTKKIDFKIEFTPILIMACFVLHNFCEKRKSYIDESFVRKQILTNRQEEEYYRNLPDPIFSATSNEGKEIRDILTKYINCSLPDNYEN